MHNLQEQMMVHIICIFFFITYMNNMMVRKLGTQLICITYLLTQYSVEEHPGILI